MQMIGRWLAAFDTALKPARGNAVRHVGGKKMVGRGSVPRQSRGRREAGWARFGSQKGAWAVGHEDRKKRIGEIMFRGSHVSLEKMIGLIT